jgi:hypothetical protein
MTLREPRLPKLRRRCAFRPDIASTPVGPQTATLAVWVAQPSIGSRGYSWLPYGQSHCSIQIADCFTLNLISLARSGKLAKERSRLPHLPIPVSTELTSQVIDAIVCSITQFSFSPSLAVVPRLQSLLAGCFFRIPVSAVQGCQPHTPVLRLTGGSQRRAPE